MNKKEKLPAYRKDEISLGELMEYGSIYIRAAQKSWVIILIFGLILAAGETITLTIVGTVDPAFTGILINTAIVTPTGATPFR